LLAVLEAKLNSISGLDAAEPLNTQAPTQPPPSSSSTAPTPVDPQPAGQDTSSAPSVQTAEPAINGIAAKDHPSYEAFFKMLRVGIPIPAVQIKMNVLGLDSSVLETPDKIIPN
jgi:WASH complex subunit CCDC53